MFCFVLHVFVFPFPFCRAHWSPTGKLLNNSTNAPATVTPGTPVTQTVMHYLGCYNHFHKQVEKILAAPVAILFMSKSRDKFASAVVDCFDKEIVQEIQNPVVDSYLIYVVLNLRIVRLTSFMGIEVKPGTLWLIF